jgi:hypothetical protein
MAQTVRIDEAAYAALRELADRDGVSLQDALAKAIEVARRERFFDDLNRGYAELSAEEASDQKLWDKALSDGLADEPAPEVSGEQNWPAPPRLEPTKRPGRRRRDPRRTRKL